MEIENDTCARCGMPKEMHARANYLQGEPVLICPTALYVEPLEKTADSIRKRWSAIKTKIHPQRE
jgi:hypothetical protein